MSRYFGAFSLTTQLRFYLLKVSDRNTNKHKNKKWNGMKLTVKTTERRLRHHSDVFIVYFKQISLILLAFPPVTLSM